MKKNIVLTGSLYVDGQFVSKKYIASVLAASGCTILKSLPKKGSDAKVVVGRVLGKRKGTALTLTAGERGFEQVDFQTFVTPKFKASLARTLPTDGLLTSERKWLESRRKSKKATKQDEAA